jgi:hypothetical protein
MRNHTPYTDWIVQEESLSAGDAQALQKHVQECASCRQMAEGWQTAQGILSQSEMVSPRAGFAGRWKARAESRTRQPNLLRTWYTIAATGLAGVLLVGAGVLASGQSIGTLLAAGTAAAASAFANMEEALQALLPVSTDANQSLPLGFWIVGIALLVLLSGAWFLILRYIASRNEKE